MGRLRHGTIAVWTAGGSRSLTQSHAMRTIPFRRCAVGEGPILDSTQATYVRL